MSDLLRGRVTGRLDVGHRVATSSLPMPIRDLVLRVVKRTRLWRRERIEVADELAAHFADGLAIGATADELIRDFGDERVVSQLIRRAKRRRRGMIWQVARVGGWAVGAIVAFYGVLEVRYLTGRATPSVDYNAVLNAAVLSTAEQDRGWPLYRKAILALDDPALSEHDEHSDPIIDAAPGSPRWPEMKAWLAAHRDSLTILHEAAAKPVLGYIRGDQGSRIDPEFAARFKNQGWLAAPEARDPRWIHLVGNAEGLYTNNLGRLVELLYLDSLDARETSDGHRFVADVQAMLGIARQVRESRPDEWTRHSADNAYGSALAVLDEMFHKRPTLLNDRDLVLLAHELSAPRVAGDWIDLSAERAKFQDLVQNMYTDDGHGDGRLTDRGRGIGGNGRFSMADYTTLNIWKRKATEHLVPPTAVIDTRRAAFAEYEAVFAQTSGLLALPRRDANWDAVFSPDRPIWDRRVRNARTTAVYNFARSYQNEQEDAEAQLGRRDGIVVGIALELYHRQNGRYPASLGELTPALLPHIPVDRMTGELVKYQLINGAPLLYSVGVDRVDDGGRFIIDADGTPHPRRASTWSPEPKMRVDGDWILFDGRPEKATTQPVP